MGITPADYIGREQAYIKHFLLRKYFTAFIHKIASRYKKIVYVDGFSGPWQSANDALTDTSFEIALSAMRSAKEAWKLQGQVSMQAILVEKKVTAFRELAKVAERYPDVDIRTLNGEFVALVPTILQNMPSDAFAFIFIDPKGWRIDIDAIAPLLRRPNAEIIFNFMFDFVNRAASMSDPTIADGLNALIKTEDWRERLSLAQPAGGQRLADVRKRILVEAFSRTLAQVGGYEFVAETPIFRPLVDRTLYSLIYATRRPPGIEVFRSVQIKTLREQENVRGTVRQAKSGGLQSEAFLFSEMTTSDTEAYLSLELAAAEHLLLELAGDALSPVLYGDVWPKVLAKHAVTKTDLNQIAAALRKDERLVFPGWVQGKRVPADGWRLYIPS